MLNTLTAIGRGSAAILAAVLPVGLLVQVLAELPDYRHPAVPIAVWISLLAPPGD